MREYSFLQEGTITTVAGAGTGFLVGSFIGHIIDKIRSSGAKSEAAEAKAKWIAEHKNDYSIKEIVSRIKKEISENKKLIDSYKYDIAQLKKELQEVNKKLSEGRAKGYTDKNMWYYNEEKDIIMENIKEAESGIKKIDSIMKNLCNILDKKLYDSAKKKYMKQDADDYEDRVYRSKQKDTGFVLGGAIGAGLGSVATSLLPQKYRF